LLALPGDTAIVQLLTQSEPDQPALRQTHFYRQTADGWQRTKPDANLWGSPHRLESSHFIFHFRQNDAEVVVAVAPQMDDLYTEIARNFGLSPNAEKLPIEVTVEQVTGAVPIPQWPHEPLVVPSPAVYLAPVELSDSAILAQSLALPLIDYLGERTIEDHAIPLHWQSLLFGLRLWQLWELDMPLAQWRDEVVKSLYMDASTDDLERISMLPEPYAELCAMHSSWMLSPIMVRIPIECRMSDYGTWLARRVIGYREYTHLERLGAPLKWYTEFYEETFFFDPTEVVALATLFEYVVATYGEGQLPLFLAGVAQYDDWESLTPTVFGVSATEFEAGWRSYLAEQYDLVLDP
jgi:hypothetical protein